MENKVETRGRKATFRTSKDIVNALASEKELSRHLKLQLVEKGYMKVVKVETEGRGRSRHVYELTGKARGLINLSKRWK